MRRVPGFIDKRVQQFEKRCLQRILRKTNGNVKAAALLVDIRRTRLYRMMRRHGLKVGDFRTQKQKLQKSIAALSTLVTNADPR